MVTVAFVGVIIVFLSLALTAYAICLTEGCWQVRPGRSIPGGSYLLDDQKTAKKFEGKDVVVTGTVDSASNTIDVQKIQAAA